MKKDFFWYILCFIFICMCCRVCIPDFYNNNHDYISNVGLIFGALSLIWGILTSLGVFLLKKRVVIDDLTTKCRVCHNKHTVFSNLNLYIDRGDIVFIVGNSGCGKTTLLNLIAGSLLPSKGEIKKSDKNIAYLMQDVTLLPYRTAWENTFLACELRGIPVDNITVACQRNT